MQRCAKAKRVHIPTEQQITFLSRRLFRCWQVIWHHDVVRYASVYMGTAKFDELKNRLMQEGTCQLEHLAQGQEGGSRSSIVKRLWASLRKLWARRFRVCSTCYACEDVKDIRVSQWPTKACSRSAMTICALSFSKCDCCVLSRTPKVGQWIHSPSHERSCSATFIMLFVYLQPIGLLLQISKYVAVKEIARTEVQVGKAAMRIVASAKSTLCTYECARTQRSLYVYDAYVCVEQRSQIMACGATCT